ncbi:TetR/AcrR family transcriptional regulator [Actinoallomurus sp. CA-150999]|uniref:TetR/AcrR family transcriptional regulator n=1 Tax=Actinoallomurus sp. CA-150999 TaxID=3239887 RepID=UPI003D8E4E1A
MTEAVTLTGKGLARGRGRIDKRRAILDAAFEVFAREGYAQAGVDAIAAEAGVAKATVYNHFGDKETLLRETFAALAGSALEQNLAVVERLADQGGDLRALLEDVAFRLLECYCDDRSRALRRLLSAEMTRFPDLLDTVQGVSDRVTGALADRLARLALAGRLDITDPLIAAEQFSALLGGPADKRSHLGTRPVPDSELRAVARAAVATFLKAFASVST